MHNPLAQKKALVAYFESCIQPEKRLKMQEVIAQRTKHITVVLENVSLDQNGSALVRSVEGFGIQDMHVVQNKYSFKVTHGIAKGSALWISRHNHASIEDAYKVLKDQGYTILATAPAVPNAYTVESIPTDLKVALVFGTEVSGLSEDAMQMADGYVTVPMHGFTQSLNVSVTAGICMYTFMAKLRASTVPWQLTEEQAVDVHLGWLREFIRGSDAHERLFLKQYNSK